MDMECRNYATVVMLTTYVSTIVTVTGHFDIHIVHIHFRRAQYIDFNRASTVKCSLLSLLECSFVGRTWQFNRFIFKINTVFHKQCSIIILYRWNTYNIDII